MIVRFAVLFFVSTWVSICAASVVAAGIWLLSNDVGMARLVGLWVAGFLATVTFFYAWMTA